LRFKKKLTGVLMSTGKIILLVVFLILAGIGTITYLNRNQTTETQLVSEVVTETFPVRVKKMAPEKIVQKLNRAATIEAGKDVTVNAEVPGRVKRIHLSLGDVCRTGAKLVSLERDTYEIAVLSAKATLQQAEVALSQAQKTLARINQLRESDMVSPQDAEMATTQVESGRATVDQARSGYRLAQKNLKETRILCPFDGRVAEMHVEVGQSLSPGVPVARIVDTEALKITVSVSSAQLSRMAEGQKVMLTPQTYGQTHEAFEGTVAHLGVAADANTGLFPVEVSVRNDGKGSLRPGMVVRAVCELGIYDEVLAIGRDVVLAEDGQSTVFVVENGTAKRRTVKTGERVGDDVLIVEGVKKGDAVVVSGQDALTDGSRVRVIRDAGREAQ
jgi:RND family efflux transporter MFP subunit